LFLHLLFIQDNIYIKKKKKKKKVEVKQQVEVHQVEDHHVHSHYRCPSIVDAEHLPRRFQELSNEIVSIASLQGFFGARRERLVREIMRVDKITHEEAYKKLEIINQQNDQYAWIITLPFRVGFTIGITAAFTSIPMVFHKGTAAWFNEHFVHESLPEGGLESLDTIWKVGNWTWGWMEPYLGTASFVLLGLQFARVHLQKMNKKPYTEWVLSRRADRLAGLFPQYERQIVRDFAKSDPWHT